MRSTAIQKTLILSVILTLWGSVHAFAQFAGGDGSEGNPYQIATATQLNDVRDNLDKHFMLIADIDLDVAPYNTGDGWEPIGDSGDPFSGTLDGNFFEITGLYIDRTSDSGLFGRANSATIKNLGILDADIKSEAGAGILLHYSSNGIHISKVYTTGKIESSGQYIGGIAGRLYDSDIEQSYSRASVSGDNRVGGLVGEAGTTTISNSYATGLVTSNNSEGGLVGAFSATASNSFWDTETTNQASSFGGGTGLTTTEMHDVDEYTDWDFDDVWAMDAGVNDDYPYLRAAYFAGGAGTEADPFEISNVYHLQNMKDHLEAHFVVINDVDASVTEDWNDGNGWEPVGNGDDPFVGSLDGGGFPIKNLYINREDENPIGLFGAMGDGSIATNIGLEDANISGDSAVGTLAGRSEGVISNVFITDVDISSVANVLGAVVGDLSRGEINSSFATGVVNSEGDDIGGLVGYMFEGAISNSYADVAVTSTGVRGVGGLVGFNHVNSTVNNSYSIGAVEGAEEFGGLIGRIRDGGVVTNSFWDIEKSGNADSDGGEGKSTAEMNAIATFTDAGWDFDDMWDFDQTKNNGYPFLQFYEFKQELLNSIIVWNTSIGTERTNAGSLVSTLFADDPEEDTFTFSLVAGDGDNDNSDFTIDGDELRTGNTLAPGDYSIRMSASNQQNESVEEAFTITVTEGKVAPKVAGGDSHTLLLTSDGTVYSFGNGGWGKLGHGNSDQLLVPTAIVSDELADKTIIDVAAGNIHSMLLASDGTVFTFGGSSNGQLGHNDTDARDVPTKIESPNLDGKQITAIDADGEFSMLLASDGTVFTFGSNLFGQLGHGDEDDRTVPTRIDSDILEGQIIKAIDIGRQHSILLASDGSVFTFGISNGGQLGHGDRIKRSEPKKIDSANLVEKEIVDMSAGLTHSVLLAKDGTVFTFGLGSSGRIGHGDETDKLVPTEITSPNLDGKIVVKTGSGHMHNLLLTSDGTILTFGAGSQGQLGHGDNDDRLEPVEITSTNFDGKLITDIDGGVLHSILLDSDGNFYTFGLGSNGRLGHGDDDNRNVPTEITEFQSPPQTPQDAYEAPEIQFPADNMDLISIAPRLSWSSSYENVQFNVQFQVQLSGDDGFSSIMLDTTVSEFNIDIEALGDETEYFWRVRLEDEESQSPWSDAAGFTTRPRPDAQQSVEVSVDFGGVEDENGVVVSSDYRLIGAPGTDVIPLNEVFQQEYDEVWKAFYDNGEESDDESDYFIEYTEGDEDFKFTPGRGFWVLSTEVVELHREIDNVTVNHRDNYPIPLEPGWNIISNPHLVDVKWTEVLELNGLNAPLYSYEKSFQEAEMMAPFEGYYFYNSSEPPLDTLEIPYTNFDRRGLNEEATASRTDDLTEEPGIHVQADFSDDDGNNTQVSVDLVYPETLDDKAQRNTSYHPSLEFSRYGIMLGYEGSERTGIRKKAYTYQETGEEYELELKAPVGTTVTWSADMTGMGNAARIMLVNPVTSQSHLLSHGESVEVTATEPEVTYDLHVGDEAYLQEIQENLLPSEITLKQNYPNPFNPATTIQYALPVGEMVRLEVYDILGRQVQVLQDGHQQAGWYTAQFDGARMASGLYIYRLVAGQQNLTGKMLLVK